MSTSIQEAIEFHIAGARRLQAALKRYPDAELITLPDGRQGLGSESVEGCDDVEFFIEKRAASEYVCVVPFVTFKSPAFDEEIRVYRSFTFWKTIHEIPREVRRALSKWADPPPAKPKHIVNKSSGEWDRSEGKPQRVK